MLIRDASASNSISAGSVPATISCHLHRKADPLLRDTGADLRETNSITSTLHIGSILAYGSTDGRLHSR